MKPFFTLLMLLSVVNVFSQQTTKNLVSIDSYLYNSEGKETESHSYSVLNGNPSGPDKTYTLYNGSGNIIKKVTLNLYNDTTEKITYLYENKKLTITSFTYSGSLITPEQKTIYYGVNEFKEINEMVAVYFLEIPMYKCDSFQVYSWNSTNWQLSTTGKYTFSNNNPTKLLMSMNDYVEGMTVNLQITYQYDSKYNCKNMYISVLMMNIPLSLMNIDQTFNASSLCTETYIYPNVNPLLAQSFGEDLAAMLGEEKIKYTYNSHNDVKSVTMSYLNDSLDVFQDVFMSENVYKQATINGTLSYLLDTVYGYDITQTVSTLNIQAQNVNIFPNPANNSFYLEGVTSPSTIEMYDISGKLLVSKTWNVDDPSINIESLKSGMYILKIKNEDGVIVSRFLKQRN